MTEQLLREHHLTANKLKYFIDYIKEKTTKDELNRNGISYIKRLKLYYNEMVQKHNALEQKEMSAAARSYRLEFRAAKMAFLNTDRSIRIILKSEQVKKKEERVPIAATSTTTTTNTTSATDSICIDDEDSMNASDVASSISDKKEQNQNKGQTAIKIVSVVSLNENTMFNQKEDNIQPSKSAAAKKTDERQKRQSSSDEEDPEDKRRRVENKHMTGTTTAAQTKPSRRKSVHKPIVGDRAVLIEAPPNKALDAQEEAGDTNPTYLATENIVQIVKDIPNPNIDLMKKVAFLRVCVNYIMSELNLKPITFKPHMTLYQLKQKYSKK